MANNYNTIAPFYDILKKIVFGNSLLNTECHFLKNVPENSRLIVLGCGTSEFLEIIDTGLYKEIVCLDKSEGMCQKSSNRAEKLGLSHKLKVINQDFLNFSDSETYDFIAMPYFLDCQSDENIPLILQKAKSILDKEGHLIISDFNKKRPNSLINNTLVKIMYLFFRISTGIPRKALPDYDLFIQNKDWKMEKVYSNSSGVLFSKKLKNNSVQKVTFN